MHAKLKNSSVARFGRLLERYNRTTTKSAAEIINQRTLNVAGKTFDLLPPRSGPGADRHRGLVRRYLQQQLSTRTKLATSGKRKGRYIRRGAKKNQLQRIHLIVQARRAAAGKKGLYGDAMRAASGSLLKRSMLSVGYLKSAFLPVITTLNPLVPFKFPHRKTFNISRWPGSLGHGRVLPASKGWAPLSRMVLSWKLRGPRKGIGARMLDLAFRKAMIQETADLGRHVARKMGVSWEELRRSL